MLFNITATADRPAYLQIVDQVKYAAASGRLRPGEGLPSIRQLAEQLRVNRNTVDKAYRELDRLGLITTAQGRGAFLAPKGTLDIAGLRQELLTAAVDGLIRQAQSLRVDPTKLTALIEARQAVLTSESATATAAISSQEDRDND